MGGDNGMDSCLLCQPFAFSRKNTSQSMSWSCQWLRIQLPWASCFNRWKMQGRPVRVKFEWIKRSWLFRHKPVFNASKGSILGIWLLWWQKGWVSCPFQVNVKVSHHKTVLGDSPVLEPESPLVFVLEFKDDDEGANKKKKRKKGRWCDYEKFWCKGFCRSHETKLQVCDWLALQAPALG